MKRKLLIAFSAITIILLLYSIGAYIYLQMTLVPALKELTTAVQTVGNLIIPALLITGIYHLILLIRKLKSLTGKFLDGVFVVMIVLSGIILLSDMTLLLDIGKEYLLFDVTGEWLMLYGFAALHLVTVIIGFLQILRNESGETHLFRIDKTKQENLFLEMHHIGLFCGILGLIGIILSLTGLIVPMRFWIALMIVVSGLVACPLAMIIVYWLISMSKSKRGEWTDEKQRADTGRAAIAALIVYMTATLVIIAIESLKLVAMPISFWLLSVFFIMLTLFSSVIIRRNS